MQAQYDISRGRTWAAGADRADRDFWVRRLRDSGFCVPIRQMVPAGMAAYAALCGSTLARAYTRCGDRVTVAAYQGAAKFEQAVPTSSPKPTPTRPYATTPRSRSPRRAAVLKQPRRHGPASCLVRRSENASCLRRSESSGPEPSGPEPAERLRP